MNRRHFMTSLGLYALAGKSVHAGTPVPKAGVPTDGRRPNFVLILADDLGYGDIGCYGNMVNETPHLDRLAREGLRFTDFHANGPMCTPTRAALLTGLYQNRFGRAFEGPLSAKAHRDTGLPLEAVTIADALKAAGYATAMYGKWHLGYAAPFLPTRQGFDEFRGLLTGDGDHHSHISRSGTEDWWHNETIEMEKGYSAELITRHSIEFMERHRNEPFFLYMSHLAIHFPWQGPNEQGHRVKGRSYWDLTKLGPHKEGEVAPVVREMVEAFDKSVGDVMAAIRGLALERDTFVFFCSDNGGYLRYAGRFEGEISSNGALRGQKGDVYEGGHRVPAIAWWLGRIKAGGVTQETTMTMDLMPTMTELAGAKAPAGLDGISLAPLLLEGKSVPKRDLFWRKGDHWAARRGPWKLVATGKKQALYNLADDIGETKDLSKQNPQIHADLLGAFKEWAESVDGKRNTR